MNSIRVRLSIFILMATLGVSVVVGVLTFQHTLQQYVKLFDYQLRQTALSLRNQGVADKGAPDIYAEEALDIVVQIWSVDGRLIYQSHPGTVLPDPSIIGFSRAEAGGVRWRVYTMPTMERVIQVAHPVEVRRSLAMASALRSLSPLLAFGPLLALLIWWLIGRELKAVKRLEKDVMHRHAKSLDPLSEQGLPREITPVVQALNQLLVRLHRAFCVQRAFIGDAAHELRSPLTALTLQVDLLEQAQTETQKSVAISQLRQGMARANRLIGQLLAAARTEPGEKAVVFSPVNLAEEARRAVGESFSDALDRDIAIEFSGPEEAVVTGDSAQLQTMMRNLIDNAIRYTPEGGRVAIAVQAGEGQVVFLIDDNGPGIPEAQYQQVFQRFYRGETRGQPGSGLGLAIVRNIGLQHDAAISLHKAPLGGLRVKVQFPDAERMRADAAAQRLGEAVQP
ncbi:MAG: ATP-binding protein [Burkholderiaceae bacterium]